MRWIAKFVLLALALVFVSGAALAQTKLKWAHVYETSEPYHKWSVWAAGDIEQAVQQLCRDEGPEDARARRSGISGLAEIMRGESNADRLRRGLPRVAERHRRRAGESAHDDRGEEVL